MDDSSTPGMSGVARGPTAPGGPDHNTRRVLWGIPGTMLTLSVVGAPIGLWMLKNAHAHQDRLRNGEKPHKQSGWSDVVRELGTLIVDGSNDAPRDDS